MARRILRECILFLASVCEEGMINREYLIPPEMNQIIRKQTPSSFYT